MRPSPKHLMVVALGAASFGAAVAEGQLTVPAGNAEIPVTTPSAASAYQGAPAVASDAIGDVVVAWSQQSATTGGSDIFVQRYSIVLGAVSASPASQVTVASSACRQAPAVAVDGAGNFVVVWVTNESGVEAIMGQRYASTGQLSGGLISVSPPATTNQQAPAVAMAPDGRFLVVWQSAQANGGWSVVGQAYAAGGAAAGSPITVNPSAAGTQHSPAVAYLPASAAAGERFEAVWQIEGQDGSGAAASGILAAAFDANGNALGGELAINAPATGAHAHPRIAADPSGNFDVVWENVTTSAGSTVLVRRFTAAGTPLSAPTPVDQTAAGSQRNPVVAADQYGFFVVSWDSLSVDGSGTAVLAQQFDNHGIAAGNPAALAVQINATTAGDQGWPAVAADDAGDVFLLWQSVTPAVDQSTIAARLAAVPSPAFYTIPPCRAVDTRNVNGPQGGPVLTSGQVRTFPIGGQCGVPPTARAVSVNETVVAPSGDGDVILYPGDTARPTTSSINFSAGAVRANNGIFGLSRAGDGSLAVFPFVVNTGQVHLIIDVNGFFQ